MDVKFTSELFPFLLPKSRLGVWRSAVSSPTGVCTAANPQYLVGEARGKATTFAQFIIIEYHIISYRHIIFNLLKNSVPGLI